LTDFCSRWQEIIKDAGVDHVKFHCDKNNYLIIELTEDKEFSFKQIFNRYDEGTFKTVLTYYGHEIDKKISTNIKQTISLIKGWFGFREDTFTKKGKYYSTKPIHFYRTDLFLRSNLVDQQKTFYNNKYSDILCTFPVDDGEQIKLQRYEPMNCHRKVNRKTNYFKFEITDEKGKVIDFRGMPIVLHLTFISEK